MSPATRWGLFGLVLIVILTGQLCFKLYWEAGTVLSNQHVPAETFRKPLKLFLPFTLEGGYVRWSATGLVITTLLDNLWGAATTIYVLSAVLTCVAFLVSWLAFRSPVFTLTFTLWIAFGPQFNYAWVNASCSIYYLLVAYVLINLLFLFRLCTTPDRSPMFNRLGFLLSLLVVALCWETWLDYFVFLFLVCCAGLLLRLRHPDLVPRANLFFVCLSTIAVVVPYLWIRVMFGGNHNEPGSECGLLFQHRHLSLIWEDYFSNVLTYLFITFSNFIPYWFVNSSALPALGDQGLIESQNGYHTAYAHLVPMHYHYFWHFHAGIMFCLFVCASLLLLRRAVVKPTSSILLSLALIALIATGFSTHSLIKFRPYLSVPVLAYKPTLSILGASLLVAFLVKLSWERYGWSLRGTAVVTLAWSLVFVCGFTHPGWQAQLLSKVGLGGPPDPLRHYSAPRSPQSASLP